MINKQILVQDFNFRNCLEIIYSLFSLPPTIPNRGRQ